MNVKYKFRTLDKDEADAFAAKHKLKHPTATVRRAQDKVTVHDTILEYGEPASPDDPPPIVGKKEGPAREVDRYIVESDVKP